MKLLPRIAWLQKYLAVRSQYPSGILIAYHQVKTPEITHKERLRDKSELHSRVLNLKLHR